MQVRELTIAGAWEFTPVLHGDDRGLFLESFKQDVLSELIGKEFHVAQTNTSVSSVGVLRGIHFADVPPGQAKYVTCTAGAVIDVVVDLREGSPTFGEHDVVLLDDMARKAVYLAEGLGHGFCAISNYATVNYLCSTGYNPGAEHGIDPLDEDLAIHWPTVDRDGNPLDFVLSDKDREAPSFAEVKAAGGLPTWQP